jgi:hypothetical protein
VNLLLMSLLSFKFLHALLHYAQYGKLTHSFKGTKIGIGRHQYVLFGLRVEYSVTAYNCIACKWSDMREWFLHFTTCDNAIN